jgi:hypothetical protein
MTRVEAIGTGGGPTVDKPDVAFVPPEDPRQVSHSLTIRAPDCRAAYETLRSRGAEFLTPPRPHSIRALAVKQWRKKRTERI